MKTAFFPSSEDLAPCGELIRQGELVCFPTETVYGLGANALDGEAVSKIFQVKNRPADNPLIVHICDPAQMNEIAKEVPKEVKELTEAFWPGPLTVVLPKKEHIPTIVSAGLETVAIRCPNHPVALQLIKEAGVPIVAPSANLSGRPSPTCFGHCQEDLNGKIAAIIDGGPCGIGVESTVLLPLFGRKVQILRPGGITPAHLEQAGFEVVLDPAVLAPVKEGQKVSSPGMLHRHYAPKAPMTIVTGEAEAVCKAIQKKQAPDVWVLAFEEYLNQFEQAVSFGSESDPLSQSQALFDALRHFDTLPCKQIYAMYPQEDGVGLAVRNRLLRAASFQIIPAERL